MHSMDNTPRIITIIGLIFEGLGVLGSFFGGWLLQNIESIPFMTADMADLPQDEFDEMIALLEWLGGIIYGLAIVLAVVFVINLVLFVRLIGSRYTEEQAKKVYLYQAIWGGVNILFNQVTGILYLISGVSGYSGHREERNIREGI